MDEFEREEFLAHPFARKFHKALIESKTQALDGLLTAARESSDPRVRGRVSRLDVLNDLEEAFRGKK